MNTLPQRWLSIVGIATELNLTTTQIKLLYKQRLLVRIGKRPDEHRYLDPTPEYAERLRLAAVMLSKQPDIPTNLPLTFLLTVQEIAEILGKTRSATAHILDDNKVPCFKSPTSRNRAKLYSVTSVRDLVWRRNGRNTAVSKQKAPVLLKDFIAYFWRFQAGEDAVMPTDAQFREDAELERKLEWILRQPNRDALLAQFMSKMNLAKQVVTTASQLQATISSPSVGQ